MCRMAKTSCSHVSMDSRETEQSTVVMRAWNGCRETANVDHFMGRKKSLFETERTVYERLPGCYLGAREQLMVTGEYSN